MRWIINCTILAAIAATALAAQPENPPRPPRSLTLIKDLVSSKLFGSEEPVAVHPNYRIFRVPGYDNILVKAVPKVPLPAEAVVADPHSVHVHPSIALVSSYLGTNSPNETLFALRGVKNLLQSGILETQGNASVSYGPVQIPTAIVEPTKDVVYTRRVCTTCAYPSIQHVVPIPYAPIVEDLRKPVRVPLPDLLYPTKYSYKQIHHDGVTSYTANDNKNVIITESQAPVRLPPYINSRFQEVLALGINPVPVNAVPRMPVYVSQPSPFAPFYDVPVPVNPYGPIGVAPAPVPINYSYKHLHHDGSVTTHFGSGNVEENKGERAKVYYSSVYQPPAPLTPFIEVSDVPRVSVNPYLHMKVTPAIVPTNYSYKHLHNDGTLSTFSGNRNVEEDDSKKVTAPVHVSGTYQPTPFVPINDVPWIPVHPQLPMIVVPASGPTGYSYKHLHNDGTVTQYSGSGVVEEGNQRPAIVLQGISSPDPLPVFLANRIQNAAATALNYNYPPPAVVDKALYGPHIPVYQESYPVLLQHLTGPGAKPFNPHFNDEVKVNFDGQQHSGHTVYHNVPSGHSFKTIHEDGTSTVHFDSRLVQESIKKQKLEDITNNFKGDYQGHYYNSASSSSSKATDCITDTHVQNVAHQSVQSQENGNSNTGGFSYTAVHNDGSVTAFSDSTIVHKNNESATTPRKVPTTTRRRLRKPIRPLQNRPTDVLRGSDELQNNSHSQTVTSQYTYKQIKHHNPNELSVAQVTDTPKLDGQISVQVEVDDVAITSRPYISNTSPYNKKGEDSVSITPSHSVYIPPSTVPGSTLRPALAVATKPVPRFSYKHRHRVNTSNGATVDYKTKTSSNSKDSEHTRAYYTTEAVTSTSAISLSANPIVVLPDEQIFSYKQDKSDGSSVTVVGDNKNKVTVVEDNKSEGSSNRGDIPEEAY